MADQAKGATGEPGRLVETTGWRSGRLASLGLIITRCRRRARTRLVAGGTIRLRLAGRSTVWHDVFTILLLFLFALVAGIDLLRRVFTFCRFQHEPLLRLSDAVIIYLRGKDAGVGVVGNRRGALDDRRPHRL